MKGHMHKEACPRCWVSPPELGFRGSDLSMITIIRIRLLQPGQGHGKHQESVGAHQVTDTSISPLCKALAALSER